METTRLTFRDWQLDDVEPFHVICSDPRVMQFVGDGRPWSRDKTRSFIERAMAASRSLGYCQWPLIYKPDAQLIGYCGFVAAEGGAEIGWRLSPQYWGQGLATEAARCALQYGFETLEFESVKATVQARNPPSIRIVEKLGMQVESSFQRDGNEMLLFSIRRAGIGSS